jgi:hypothetical protein
MFELLRIYENPAPLFFCNRVLQRLIIFLFFMRQDLYNIFCKERLVLKIFLELGAFSYIYWEIEAVWIFQQVLNVFPRRVEAVC